MSEDLLKAFELMLLIRRFEEKAGQLYGMGLIGGFCHLYIGQEAVVTGIQSCMKPIDSVITSYRDHAHMLACGMDPKGVMAELTGRAGGYSKGKGGSMHMFSQDKRFYGGHGIVGAQVSLGTGIAFAQKYKETGGICATYMGDGAVNQGQVYESFNLASLWKLPAIYVIEDNKYGMGTSVDRASCTTDFVKRGMAYGIPGRVVDGMDFLKMREDATWAVNHARTEGPALLHVKTYRYRGHSMSDPGKYRSKEETDDMKTNHDPIQRLKELLKEDEVRLKGIEKRVKSIVEEAVEFAKSSPEPNKSELYTDVYV